MKILLKLGGTLLDDPASRARLSEEIAAAHAATPLAVVHGGGKQMTRFLAERGVESKFVNGLRVTTPEVVDALLKVFAGSVNHELVASFVKAGALPVGLTGIDAALTEAELLSPELGQVGRPVRANVRLLQVLGENGFLPVIACVAGNRHGEIFNVNADQMAVACASALRVESLVFLTDVPGVKDATGQVVPSLTVPAAQALIRDGIATGGMEAKLNSAIAALESGVGSVVIAPGAEPGIVARILSGEPAGTRFVLS